MFQPVDPKKTLPKVEHEMLNFWEQEHIFEQSLEKRRKEGAKKYVFFDGPPFANGLPHYGHILANALKDAVTRYWTMKGYYVPRVNGWDCHGLPVEYEIEKELKLSGKKDIEKLGVAKFNSACRKSVFRYTEEWEKLLKRIARWVDFEHSYATLENGYMESIWWIFSEIWKKKMVYQGYKSMHVCPRCETPLSNFEVTLGYKEVVDLATIVKFKIIDQHFLKKYCEGRKTSFVAWTTTPWSIPTTMGLAVGPTFDYVIVSLGKENIICAKNRLAYVTEHLQEEEWKVAGELKGEKMLHIPYEHPFPQYKNHPDVKNNPKTYFTYAKDYVSVGDGTGIVTINGAFGEIDMQSAKESGLPIVVNVRMDGTYTEEMGEFTGKYVKDPKLDEHLAAYLAKRGALLRKEPTKHSYPHCWRCDTPLLNYSMKSWFIRVTDIKERLLKNNQKIQWVPEHIREGRFGKWLENVRDWNISRNRFWGCPIPVWECETCHNQKCIPSIKELREHSAGGNTFYFVRHGEAEHNVQGIVSSDSKKIYRLTEKGRKQAAEAVKKLKQSLTGKSLDMIFTSPVPRAKETAELFGKAFGMEVGLDQHLREHETGPFEGKPEKEFVSQFKNLEERYGKRIGDAEAFQDVETRIAQFIDFLNRKYSGKTFLLVTHGNVIRGALHALGEKTLAETFQSISPFGGITKIYAGKLPKRNGELDLHKPYIDEIILSCEKCKGMMRRIPEVLDCWFESGAMPYAQLHYPYENKEEFEENFPAHFIAEGLDQTRGWFYTLHVLSAILFDVPAFQNVIVNGILLAADGEKFSKRKKNYPDPHKLFETHGVDSTRMFLYTSNAPLADDVRFSEKHVEDIVKKFTLTLWNTYSFFMTYASIDKWKPKTKTFISQNKLDQWLISELHTLIKTVTESMDSYNLTLATRPILDFVEGLSNWYVRRSRRRFWKSENDGDKNHAYETLFAVLVTLSKLLAPFMPFVADSMFKNLTGATSVHLEDWPTYDQKKIDLKLNQEVNLVRKIVALGHALRSKKSTKVRQPLQKLQIVLPGKVSKKSLDEYLAVISEELNVKSVEILSDPSMVAKPAFLPNPRSLGPKYGADVQKIIKLCKEGKFTVEKDGSVKVGEWKMGDRDGTLGYEGKEDFDVMSEGGLVAALDTHITEELKQEGYIREMVRNLQEMRKEAGYAVNDRIYVFIKTKKSFQQAINVHLEYLRRETLAMEIQEKGNFEWDIERHIDLDGIPVTLAVRK